MEVLVLIGLIFKPSKMNRMPTQLLYVIPCIYLVCQFKNEVCTVPNPWDPCKSKLRSNQVDFLMSPCGPQNVLKDKDHDLLWLRRI